MSGKQPVLLFENKPDINMRIATKLGEVNQ